MINKSETEIIKQNSLIFKLNEEVKKASVIGNDQAIGDIFIPQTINYKSQDYIVTSISAKAFENSKTIISVSFPSDSKVDTIEKDAFLSSTIEKLLIPSSITDLQEGFCRETPKLTKIAIMPNNKQFIYIDNKMIVGKSDINKEEYDNLLFVRRDAESIIIPTFIKKIGRYSFSEGKIVNLSIPPQVIEICEGAFYNCHDLQHVEISSDSQLKTIETLSFLKTSIESIQIPSSVSNLCDDWCDETVRIIKNGDDEEESFDPSEWFEKIFGFSESVDKVKENFDVTKNDDFVELTSKVNNKKFNAGHFEIKSSDRSDYNLSISSNQGRLHLIHGYGMRSACRELIDILDMQSLKKWDGATYLVASNFNCLEFVSSEQTASEGVTFYYADCTQGPYAALACCPSIVYRNYFVDQDAKSGQIINEKVDDDQIKSGQVIRGQIDKEINLLEKTKIPVVHGYAIINEDSDLNDYKTVENSPKIWQVGIHRNCQVVIKRGENGTFSLAPSNRIANHVYAAAFNFQSDVEMTDLTKKVATDLLTGEYRAAILAAWENSALFADRAGAKKLSLTLLGGGVFGNPIEIICDAIKSNVDLIKESGLDVYVACFDNGTFYKVHKNLGKSVQETGGKIYDANDKESCQELL